VVVAGAVCVTAGAGQIAAGAADIWVPPEPVAAVPGDALKSAAAQQITASRNLAFISFFLVSRNYTPKNGGSFARFERAWLWRKLARQFFSPAVSVLPYHERAMVNGQSVACLLSVLVAQTLFATALERSVSPSQQFVIYGVDRLSRGAISELAESTKANLLSLLRRADEWKVPIIINLQRPQANLPEIPPAGLRFSQTGFGLKLQLDLVMAAGLDRAALERNLLHAIVLEMIYRGEPNLAPGTSYAEPPDWLLDGVLALAPGRDRAPLIEALAVSNKVMSLGEFLDQRPALLDSPARQLYRAYSFALVQLLVDQTDGRKRLARYIGNLSRATSDSLADLRVQFPELAGNDADRIWKSNIVRLSKNYQLLTFTETERELDQSLQTFGDEKSKGESKLRELSRRKISRSEVTALNQLSERLSLLAACANPISRPTVQEYQRISSSLAAGKNKRMGDRLARTGALRVQIAARMSEIDDYMNWCEATKTKTQSGVFANYLSAAEQQNELRPRRHDALSVYLDALEEELDN
jgi:hypothetical protein